MKKILKSLTRAIIGVIFVTGLAFSYFNLSIATPDTPYELGTTFSWKYAENLKLDWKEVYAAMYDDLDFKKVRIPVYWDYIESTEGQYNWDKLDYEVEEAEKRDAELTLAIGQKVPRWPECFVPEWAKDDREKRQERLLLFITAVIDRYKDSHAVERWQIENEPFLAYGAHCPEFEVDFLDREIAAAHAADPSRPVVTTDSGEINMWLRPAKRGDIFGTTMYRTVYTQEYGYFEYPLGPRFFQTKRNMIKWLVGQENAIVIELQTEPWMPGWVTDFPIEEQLIAMNGDLLKENVEYARQGGFSEIFTWGVEWWYYVKEAENDPSVWNAVKELMIHSEQSRQ